MADNSKRLFKKFSDFKNESKNEKKKLSFLCRPNENKNKIKQEKNF